MACQRCDAQGAFWLSGARFPVRPRAEFVLQLPMATDVVEGHLDHWAGAARNVGGGAILWMVAPGDGAIVWEFVKLTTRRRWDRKNAKRRAPFC